MTKLGKVISEHIIASYGPSEFLTRLSDPFWFQALGCVMGMDWHSSGITTSVMGALKRGLNSRSSDLGICICGGRGRHSRRTPDELRAFSGHTGLDGDALARTSRLTARVDNNAIGDGFQLYLHSFVVSTSGEWAVIQQDMNSSSHLARRYHWHSADVRDFTSDPHTAILGKPQGIILNLVDARASRAQQALLNIVKEPVDSSLAEFRKLAMPIHHNVRPQDVALKRLGAVLAVAHEQELRDFAGLLLVEGLGARTLQSLALIAEVMHGAASRFSDPARFSFGLGGKDGQPSIWLVSIISWLASVGVSSCTRRMKSTSSMKAVRSRQLVVLLGAFAAKVSVSIRMIRIPAGRLSLLTSLMRPAMVGTGVRTKA